MYIIIGLGLICATIGFVVGSAVRWKIDYEAETIGSLMRATRVSMLCASRPVTNGQI